MVRIPASAELAPGETVYLVDDEGDAAEADVLSVASDTAQVRIRWERSPVTVLDLELTPMAHQTGNTYLHDVCLDSDDPVAPRNIYWSATKAGRL